MSRRVCEYGGSLIEGVGMAVMRRVRAIVLVRGDVYSWQETG